MVDERPGTVWISEDFDRSEQYLLSGRFSARWEATHGRDFLDGPEGVSADEAIAWGREHADLVLIRPADSDVYYSAGRRNSREYPTWPDGKQVRRRRWKGMEHLDIAADEPIAWQVRLPRRVSVRHPEDDLERLRELLGADEAVADLRAELQTGDDRVDAVFRFVVRARSHREAMKLVVAVEGRSMGQVPYPAEEIAPAGGGWMDEMGWDPYDDVRPAAPAPS
jgi:hypothetical protein